MTAIQNMFLIHNFQQIKIISVPVSRAMQRSHQLLFKQQFAIQFANLRKKTRILRKSKSERIQDKC